MVLILQDWISSLSTYQRIKEVKPVSLHKEEHILVVGSIKNYINSYRLFSIVRVAFSSLNKDYG